MASKNKYTKIDEDKKKKNNVSDGKKSNTDKKNNVDTCSTFENVMSIIEQFGRYTAFGGVGSIGMKVYK
jgi:hypothetical protein